MKIRVLGQLEIVDDQGRICSPSYRQRALLALLSIHPDEVLSTDRIIDELWDEPPGRTALPFHVSKLRAAIGQSADDPDGILTTAPNGYRLRTASHEIDSIEFEKTVGRARTLLRSRPSAAARLLQQALGLWRGEPYADFQYEPFARSEIERLDQLRVAALEYRISADLALGRHSGLIAELEALTARYPLRERFRHQLMLALYRSGMQARALQVFRETRLILGEELGLEPGPELVELEEQILLHEPGLLAEPARLEQPHRLGSELSSFVGRSGEIDRCLSLLMNNRIVCLAGPGGVGKTRLALAVGRQIEPSLADGAVLVPLDRAEPHADVFPLLHDALDLATHTADSGREAVLDYLREREILVILDNCEHLVESAALAVAEIVRVSRRSRVLATSRAPLRTQGEQVVRVAGLPVPRESELARDQLRADAVKLFLERAGQVRPGFAPGSDDVGLIAELCRSLEGIPLAIELAAARLSVLSIGEVCGLLDRQLVLLGEGPRDVPERHRSLDGSLRWSYDLLDRDAQLLFRRLAVTRGGFGFDAASALAGDDRVDAPPVLDLLTALIHSSLVEMTATSPVRYRMLEPVRQYAAGLLSAAGEDGRAADLHAAHYVQVVDRQCARFGSIDQLEANAVLQAEGANVEGALARLAQSGRVDEAAAVVSLLSRWWVSSGRHDTAKRWIGKLLNAAAVSEQSRMNLLRDGTYLAVMRGEHDLAAVLVGNQREIAEATDSDEAKAHSAYSEGEMRWLTGDYQAAIELWEQALDLYPASDPSSILFTLVNLGYGLGAVGSLDEARGIADRILDPVDGHFEPEAEAFAYSIRARASYIEGDLVAMAHWSQRAFDGFTSAGFEHHAVSAQHDNGLAIGLERDPEAGIEMIETALRAHQRLGDRVGEDRSRIALGLANASNGDYRAAWLAVQPAVRRLAGTAEPFQCAQTTLVLAMIAASESDYEEAALMLGVSGGFTVDGSKVWPAPLKVLRRGVESAAIEALGTDGFAEIVRKGQALDRVDVVRRCLRSERRS